MEIPIILQHRHVHLSKEHARTLFGENDLICAAPIDQRDQFLSRGLVSVSGPNGLFSEVCVIGPTRSRTQIELSASDAFAIGIDAPVRLSGDLDRSATVVLKTERGEVKAVSSTIIPIRHVHLPPSVCASLGLSNHDLVRVNMKNRPDIYFDHVVVRVHPTFAPAFHLSKDEAAPWWLQTCDIAIL